MAPNRTCIEPLRAREDGLWLGVGAVTHHNAVTQPALAPPLALVTNANHAQWTQVDGRKLEDIGLENVKTMMVHVQRKTSLKKRVKQI